MVCHTVHILGQQPHCRVQGLRRPHLVSRRALSCATTRNLHWTRDITLGPTRVPAIRQLAMRLWPSRSAIAPTTRATGGSDKNVPRDAPHTRRRDGQDSSRVEHHRNLLTSLWVSIRLSLPAGTCRCRKSCLPPLGRELKRAISHSRASGLDTFGDVSIRLVVWLVADATSKGIAITTEWHARCNSS